MNAESHDDCFVAELLREHKDLIPSPYGEHAALDQSGSVATPLMAGFALTMATIVIASPQPFRWSNPVLLMLTLAIVSLVMSVQAAQSTRAFLVRPDEIALWWPHMTAEQRKSRISEAVEHHRSRHRWSLRQRWTYRVGVLALLTGLTLALVPPEPGKGDDAISWVRWGAVAVGAVGVVVELAWTGKNALHDFRLWRQGEDAASVQGPEVQAQVNTPT